MKHRMWWLTGRPSLGHWKMHHVLSGAFLGALTLSSSLVMAQSREAEPSIKETSRALTTEQSLSWLKRIQEAAVSLTYQGTLVAGAGYNITTAHLSHMSDASEQYERIDMLDGETKHILRHNEEVKTFLPQQKMMLVSQRKSSGTFPELLGASADQVLKNYDLRLKPQDRVAGLDADVVLFKPKDAWRFAQRMWVDKQSNMLLRSEVLDEKGQVIEWTAFSDLKLVSPDALRPIMAFPPTKVAGVTIKRQSVEKTDLRQEGWQQKNSIPGFQLIQCVKRSLLLINKTTPSTGNSQVIQAIYSDGLTNVSVFMEPFNPELHRREVMLAAGANRTMAQRSGNDWVTVVGDAPVATIKAFWNAMGRSDDTP